jgi:hypothetical protein
VCVILFWILKLGSILDFVVFGFWIFFIIKRLLFLTNDILYRIPFSEKLTYYEEKYKLNLQKHKNRGSNTQLTLFG